jgi:hypothetical protein
MMWLAVARKENTENGIHISMAGAALTVPTDMKAARRRTKAEILEFMMMFLRRLSCFELWSKQ